MGHSLRLNWNTRTGPNYMNRQLLNCTTRDEFGNRSITVDPPPDVASAGRDRCLYAPSASRLTRLSDEFGQYLFAALQATDESHPVSSTDNLLGRLLSGRHSGGRVVRTDAKDSVANANVYCFAGRIRNFSPVAFRWYARITSGSSASASEISRV